MIKPVVRDTLFLNQRSEEATKADMPIVQDLEDTLSANRERCVGMAANMIGYRKRIIIAATRSSLKSAKHMRLRRAVCLFRG